MKVFATLLQQDRPNTSILSSYNIQVPALINKNSYPGWADPLSEPSEAWYNAAANSLNPPNGWVVLNHESWPRGTQAERVECARKFSAMYTALKSRRPELKFGIYEYLCKRDYWRAITPTSSAGFIQWQSENDDMAELAYLVDGFFPSIYYFYTRQANGPSATEFASRYFSSNIAETKRLRSMGDATRPIIPFVWWMKHDNTSELDFDVWQSMLRTSRDEADGFNIWGGWQEIWNEGASWWTFAKAVSSPTCRVSMGPCHTDESGQQMAEYSASLNEKALNWSGSISIEPNQSELQIKMAVQTLCFNTAKPNSPGLKIENVTVV